MRTNSLNLKKKIAFIASLAMLAGTAAYLPADIANQIGLNSAIVANADPAETPGQGQITDTPASDTTSETVENFNVTIDGKYVVKADGKYTTYSTLAAAKAAAETAGGELVSVPISDWTKTPIFEKTPAVVTKKDATDEYTRLVASTVTKDVESLANYKASLNTDANQKAYQFGVTIYNVGYKTATIEKYNQVTGYYGQSGEGDDAVYCTVNYDDDNNTYSTEEVVSGNDEPSQVGTEVEGQTVEANVGGEQVTFTVYYQDADGNDTFDEGETLYAKGSLSDGTDKYYHVEYNGDADPGKEFSLNGAVDADEIATINLEDGSWTEIDGVSLQEVIGGTNKTFKVYKMETPHYYAKVDNDYYVVEPTEGDFTSALAGIKSTTTKVNIAETGYDEDEDYSGWTPGEGQSNKTGITTGEADLTSSIAGCEVYTFKAEAPETPDTIYAIDADGKYYSVVKDVNGKYVIGAELVDNTEKTDDAYDLAKEKIDGAIVDVIFADLQKKAKEDAGNGTASTFSADKATFELPYSIVTPSSIIEIVPELKGDDEALTTASAKKVTLALDKNGNYTVPEKTATVDVQSDDSNFDLTNKKFPENEPAKGVFESFDFSGLEVSLTDGEEITAASNGLKNVTNSAAPENLTTSDAENAFVASGNVYANNLEIAGITADPGASVKINLNPKTNWTVSGTGVSSNVLTLKMGEDGKATSGLITYTRSNGEKKYYILTIKNTNTDADNIENMDIVGGQITKAAKLKETAATATDNYKITKKVEAKSVGSSSQFVSVYTIATNDSTKAEKDEIFTLTANTGVTLSNVTGTNPTFKKGEGSATDNVAEIKIEKDKLDDFTSPIMKYTSGTDKDKVEKYFQIILTTSYEIELDDDNTETKEDGKTTVTEGTKVTLPTTPTKAGSAFAGWNTNDGKKVFVAGNTIQQSTEITPNTKLVAQWTDIEYTAKFNANNGVFAATPDGMLVTARKDNDVIGISKKYTSNSDDSGIYTEDCVFKPARKGYKFLGWSTDASATEAMTEKEILAVRPTTNNAELELFAVWEANENSVKFGQIALKDNGASEAGIAEGEYSATAPTFETGVDTTGYKVKTGAMLGALPVPVKKGYTFDGWYKKVATNTATTDTAATFTAVKVSASTVISADDVTNDEITLYAKFRQNKYNVTLDLDGGVLPEDSTITSYKINGKKDSILFYNAKGGDVTKEVDPSKGSGFYTFKGWKVTIDGEEVVKDSITDIINTNDKVTNIEATAVWELPEDSKDKGSIAFDTNEGTFYVSNKDPKTEKTSYVKSNGFNAITGDKESAIEAGTVNRNVITFDAIDNDGDDTAQTYTLMKPGYTFTGWFADKDCTTAFNFDVYPNGKQVTAYAGWKANTTTNYSMRYNLIDADGSVIIPGTNVDNKNEETSSGYEFVKTYKGTTGEAVSAMDKTIEYNGKTYVFDAKLSSGANTRDEIKAGYNAAKLAATATADGEFTLETYTTSGYAADNENYTIIEGTFVDESIHSAELGKVDDVTVDASGKVTWSAADNAVKYKVVKKIGDKTYYGKETEELSYQFGSVPKTEYKVRVVAFDKDGNKTWGKEITITPAVDPEALGEIANVKVAADRKTVTWDAVKNASTYKVMKTINGKNYYTSEVADTTVTFASATKGTFSVKVIAINADGTEKKWSDAVSVEKVKSTLGTVGNAKVSEDGVVTWDKVEGAAYYRVFKVTAGVKRFSDKVEGTSYKLNNVPSRCRIYVVAYDGNGNYAVGPQTRISNVAKATDVTVSADGTKVSWKGNDDAAQYQVAKLINGKTFYGKKVDAATTEYTFGSAAKAGTQVFVITFNADGETSYSDAVTVK